MCSQKKQTDGKRWKKEGKKKKGGGGRNSGHVLVFVCAYLYSVMGPGTCTHKQHSSVLHGQLKGKTVWSLFYFLCILQHVVYLQLSVYTIFKSCYYQDVSNMIFNLRKIHFLYVLCFKYKITYWFMLKKKKKGP